MSDKDPTDTRQDAAAAEVAEQTAALSQEAALQVTVTLADQVEAGTLSHEDIIEAVADAEFVDEARDHAREMQHEQAERAESGDYEGAREAASRAQHDLDAALDRGGETGVPNLERQAARQDQEVSALGNAGWQQAIADDHASSAASYAASGDHDNAEVQADHAADHASTAASHADDGDHGGSSAAAETSGETSE